MKKLTFLKSIYAPWRWLTAFVLLFTLGITQMWATDETSTYDVSDLIAAGTITSSSKNDALDQTIDHIVYDWTKGSSSSDVKISSSRIQLFGDGQSVTISTSSSYRIKSIRFAVGNKSNSPTAIVESASAGTWNPAFTSSAFGNGNYTFTVTTPTAGGSYTFTIYKSGATNQRADFDDIVVTYDAAPVDNPTVTYYPNGATSGTVPVDANSPYTSGDDVIVLGNTGDLAKTNKDFAGWNTKEDGTGITYNAGDEISNVTTNISLYAKWVKPAAGSCTISYTLTKGKADVSGDASVTTISGLSTAFAKSNLSIGSDNSQDGYCGQITGQGTSDHKNASKYVSLAFTIADGYTFSPSAVSVTVKSNYSNMYSQVELSDGTTSVLSEEFGGSTSDVAASFAAGAFDNVKLSGTVTVKVYQWMKVSGSSKRAYIKSPVTITGTVAPPCTKPDAPTALSCTAKTVNSLTFGWTKETNAVGYVAKLYSDSGCETEVDSKNLGDVNTATFTGLSNSTIYYCKVQSKGNGTTYCEDGNVTAAANGTTETPSCGTVTAPTSLLVGATTADGVSFTIIDDADAYNYELYISESSTEPESSATATHTSTEKTKDVTGLTSGKTYYAWVRSVCDTDNKSAWTAANKSFKVRTTPTASFAGATYIIGMSAMNVADNFTSNSGASVVYELKESYPDVTLSGSSFSATAAGEYVVVANQAGNSDYMPISKEATVTVLDNELSDTYVWKKGTGYTGCVANPNADAPAAQYVDVSYEGFTGMGRAGNDNVECILTFSVKSAYSSLFGITNICTYGKFEEPAGGEISWDGGETWEDLAAYTSEAKKEFAPTAGTYPTSFKIKFLGVSKSSGGLYWRNALVTLQAKKTVTGVTEALVGAEVNGEAISSAELATLLEDKTLDIATAYVAAPTITFKKQVTTSYAGGWPEDVENVNVEVAALEVSSKWQAQSTIGTTTYTVKTAKVSFSKVYYYDGTTKIGEETVAYNGHPAEYAAKQSKNLATFVGWYSDADLADGHLIADIAAEVITADKTVYGKWTYTYAQSVNVEKWVLDNSKTPNSDQTGALISLLGTRGFASNLSYEEKKVELDSLNDGKGTGRNYAYLGLKVKYGGKMLDLRLANGQTVKVKFGATGNYPQVKINNVGSYADMSLTNNVWTYTAEGADAYISIKTSNDNAVVFQQIMIGEDIQDVTLPEPTRHAVVLTKAGETEHGTLAVASPEEYNWLAEGAAITLTVAADEGYYIESVTLNGTALTPSENVYSFNMPNATANVIATFAEIVPNSVTYMPNGAEGPVSIIDDNATVVWDCPTQFAAPASTVFAGWNTDPAGNGDAYAAGDPVLSPLQLYAQWRSYFTITYMDGETELDTENVFEGDAPVGIADPVKAFNLFLGWTLSGSDEVIDVTALTASTTVYAKWEAIDACFYFAAKSVTANEEITAPATLNTTYGGGSVEATSGDFTYTPYGVLIAGGGDKYFTVTLDKAVTTGSKITVVMAAASTGDRGLNICYEANKNSKAYDQMHWEATESGQERTFTYTLDEESALKDKKVFYLYRNNNVYLKSITVEDCAPEQYTVTYMDGENSLGTEQVYEGNKPTANGINTHKKGYEFQGWAETATGAIVDLNSITIEAAKTLYAQYTVRVCPTTGNLFTWAYDPEATEIVYNLTRTTSTEDNDVEVATAANIVTVSGGQAYLGTTSSSSTATVTDGALAFRLNGNNYAKIVLDCPLQVGDKISYTADNDREHMFYKDEISGDAVSSVNKQLVIDSDTHPLYGADVLYVQGTNKDSQFKTFSIVRLAPVTGVSLADATIAVGNTVTPTMTLLPSNEAYYESIAWSIVGEGAGTIANINATTGAVTALAAGTVTVQVKLNNSESLKATCQVEVVASFEQVDVTESTIWNWTNAAASAISLDNNTTPKKGEEGLMANIAGVYNNALFNSQAILFKGEHVRKTGGGVDYCTAQSIKFNVTVPGAVFVTFASNGSAQRTVSINGDTCCRKTNDQTYIVYARAVEPGLVEIKGIEGTSNAYVRISKIEFKAEDNYHRTVNPNNIGTLCWTNNAILGGATLYELKGKNENNYLVFDEVDENRLVAGKPYIFVPENGNTEIKVYNTSDQSVDGPVDPENGMMGTFTNLSTLPEPEGQGENSPLWNKYIISNNHYVYVDYTNCRLGAYRAYITSLDAVASAEPQQTSNGAPRRRLVVGGNAPAVATDVDNIYGNDTKVQKILINGQLFIIRGDKTYDATGRLVK